MDAILGSIIALVLSMMSLAGFVTWAKAGVTNVQTAATASQMLVFDKAALKFVEDRAAALIQQATASVPVSVTPAMLINGGYLPAGFSPMNAFGQTWLLQVLQPSPNTLQALVTSQGGRPITDTRQLVQIAAQAGAQGGFVPYAGQNGDPTMVASNAYGAYGAWQVPLANYTNPGSGRLASLLAFTGTQANNGYLYRVQVPGQPELNQMQTDLDMGANDVNNARRVTANTALTSNGDTYLTSFGQPGTACGAAAQGSIRTNVNRTGLVICNGVWQPIGTAVASVASGVACGVPNHIATNANNVPYLCKNGVYVALTSLIGKNIELARYVVGDNNVSVPKPACDAGGTPSFSFDVRSMGTDFSQSPPYTTTRVFADDYGSSWVPRIQLLNMNGGVQSGNVIGLQAIFKAECNYP